MKKEAGEELIRCGLVTTGALQQAVEARRGNGESVLTNLLFSKQVKNKDEITNCLARFLKIPVISLGSVQPDARLLRQCSKEMARKYRFIPIAISGQQAVVGMLDPMDLSKIDELSRIFNRPVQAVFIRKSDFEAHIHGLFHDTSVATGMLKVTTTKSPQDDAAALARKVLTSTIAKAVHSRASEFDFLPEKDRAFIRFRFDGVTKTVHELPAELHHKIVAHLKAMAKLDVAITDQAQAGQCRIGIGQSKYLLRVAVSPVDSNEHVRVRIIDPAALNLSLEEIGFNPSTLPRIKEALAANEGMVLVTGPARSGKACTLYAMVRHAIQQGRKVVSVEHPVRLQVDGMTQIEVDDSREQGFAEAIRTALGESDDVIMIGDLRDQDVAQLAFDAASQGHLVLAGMEAGRITEMFRALKDRGIDLGQAAPALQLISAQRLVRKLCPDCKTRANLHEEISQQWGLGNSLEFYAPKGCDKCLRSGFRDHLAVYETILVDEDIRKLIAAGTHAPEIEKQARYKGMLTLFEAGMNRAIEGSTSIEEILGSLPCPEAFNLQERLSMGRVAHLRDPEETSGKDDSLAEIFQASEKEAKEAAAEHLDSGIFMAAAETEPEPVAPVELAAAEELPPIIPDQPAEPVRAADAQGKSTILLVDDSPTTLEYIKHILTIGGFYVETADCAEKAWEMLQQQQSPDLVLTDFTLPEMSGGELIERIRQTPSCENVGTMLMTASKDEASALNSGADAFIGKPTDPDLLVARAKSIIGIYHRRAPQQQSAAAPASPPSAADGPEGIRKIEISTLEFEKKASGFELDAPGAGDAQQEDTLNGIFSEAEKANGQD